jgi:hypothetical protein
MKKKVKIRKSWGTLNPVTRVKASKKMYKRSKIKKEILKEIRYAI